MFKNLKKRIEQQGGSVSENDRLPVPGHASPLVTKSQSMSTLSTTPTKHGTNYDSDTGGGHRNSVSSPTFKDESEAGAGSKEEILTSLLKRTEQCKKLEAKIKEYAAIIKDKNKNIEKLEETLEKQQEDTVKKLQDVYDHNQLNKAKLSEGFTLALQKKDEEKEELINKIKQIEEDQNNFRKKEEENDELQGLAKQELGKVKQLLLSAKEELSEAQAELEVKRSNLETAEKTITSHTEELTSLKSQVEELKSLCDQLQEENSSSSKTVAALTSERDNQGEILKQLTSDLSQYETLQRNYDQYKSKTNQLLEEKDDHVTQLQERVKLLEQRFQDQNLSGDDRVQALETEREGLEKKLEETRQQLSEIKSTWSEKITHLEGQIAHLNKKIVEDSEEIAQSQKLAESTREHFSSQVTSLQKKLEETESRSEELLKHKTEREAEYVKEKHDLESQVTKSHFEKIDMETQLRSKITSLESQMETLEEAKEFEKTTSQQKLTQLEGQLQKYIDNACKLEKDVEQAEKDRDKIMTENIEKGEEISNLIKTLSQREESETQLKQQVVTLEDQLRLKQEAADNTDKNYKEKEERLHSSEKEKENLETRNSELEQRISTLTSTTAEEKQQLQEQIQDKELQMENLHKEIKDKVLQIDELNERLKQSEEQVQDLEGQKKQNAEKKSEMSNLQDTVASLEEQLADKNKALKKQEQRLSDLKKMLHRELKVQALPSDEPIILKGSQTPPLQAIHPSARESPPRSSTEDLRGSSPLQTIEQQRNISPSFASVASAINSNSNSVTRSNGEKLDEVNFKYLKHVVLKFMLSRESEALQLIRAVSVLLKFTHEEQRLIRETLEWKMSWFGSKPQPGQRPRMVHSPY